VSEHRYHTFPGRNVNYNAYFKLVSLSMLLSDALTLNIQGPNEIAPLELLHVNNVPKVVINSYKIVLIVIWRCKKVFVSKLVNMKTRNKGNSNEKERKGGGERERKKETKGGTAKERTKEKTEKEMRKKE
jgi:hypothetical protein